MLIGHLGDGLPPGFKKLNIMMGIVIAIALLKFKIKLIKFNTGKSNNN